MSSPVKFNLVEKSPINPWSGAVMANNLDAVIKKTVFWINIFLDIVSEKQGKVLSK